MGCAASHTPVFNADDKVLDPEKGIEAGDGKNDRESSTKYPPGEAFEVFIETNTEDSLVKKHPPKRLQRLQGETQSSSPTIEELTAKLANAEIRRQQYLMEKIGGAKLKDQRDSESPEDNGRPVTAEMGDDGKSINPENLLIDEKINL